MAVNVSTNRYSVAKIIVGQTIAEGANYDDLPTAYAAALTGDTVWLRDGTFDIGAGMSLRDNINICTYEGAGRTPNVIIRGKLTANFTGTVTLSGVRLQTNGDYALEATGSNTVTVYTQDVFVDGVDHSPVNNANSNASLLFRYSQGISNSFAPFTQSAGLIETQFGSFDGNTTPSLITGGTFRGSYTNYTPPFVGSNSANITLRFCNFSSATTCVTYNDESTGELTICRLNSGSASCLVSNSSATNPGPGIFGCVLNTSGSTAVSGSGVVYIGNDNIINNGASLITTSTVIHYPTYTGRIIIRNQVQITSGNGSPNGVITAPKGSFYMRTDGTTTNNRAYINTNGGTTWTALMTVA